LISEFDEMSQSSDDMDEDSGQETKDDEGLNYFVNICIFKVLTYESD